MIAGDDTTGTSGSARSRLNCKKACTIAGFVGRTLWNTSPPMSTSRVKLDGAIDCRPKRPRDICFPLVDAAGSETLVLPKSEVQVREMDETHAAGCENAERGDQSPGAQYTAEAPLCDAAASRRSSSAV